MLWAAFCVFGFLFAVYLLFDYPIGSESWWVGVLMATTVLMGFLSIEGWWLLSQREVSLGSETVVVRRWSDALLARRGQELAIERIRSVRLVFENGKKVRIDLRGGKAISFWAAPWSREELDHLIRGAQMRGIPVQEDW